MLHQEVGILLGLLHYSFSFVQRSEDWFLAARVKLHGIISLVAIVLRVARLDAGTAILALCYIVF